MVECDNSTTDWPAVLESNEVRFHIYPWSTRFKIPNILMILRKVPCFRIQILLIELSFV